jgi:hypothetical protein
MQARCHVDTAEPEATGLGYPRLACACIEPDALALRSRFECFAGVVRLRRGSAAVVQPGYCAAIGGGSKIVMVHIFNCMSTAWRYSRSESQRFRCSRIGHR